MHKIVVSILSLTLGSVWASEPGGTVNQGPACVITEEQAQSIWQQGYLTGDWGGARTKLADKGVNFSAEYTGEVLGNPKGGLRKNGVVYEGLLDLGLDLDLEKLTGWWKGGSVHTNAFWIHGDSVSRKYVGDLLTISNKDAYDTVRLFELWYQQNFLSDTVSLRVGQMAADEEFAISDYGGLFLNGTFGWPAGIASNAATPAYAVATPGVRLRVDPIPQLYFQAAVFDGSPDSFHSDGSPINNSGTRVNLNEEEGLFSIYELGFKLNQEKNAKGLPGTYRVGGWWHSDVFNDSRYDSSGLPLAGVFGLTDDGTGTGGVTPAVVTGTGKAKANKTNWGLYAIIDQMLWREPVQKNCHCCEGKADSEQGLGFFYRVMGSPSDRNLIEFYTDGGLTYKGLLPTRDEDVVGVSVAYAQMGSGVRKAQRDTNAVNNGNTVLNGGLPRDNNGDGFLNRNDLNQRLPDFEMVLETTYQVHLAEWWYIQPDFQYVFHPGGSAQLPDAVVIGARTGIAF